MKKFTKEMLETLINAHNRIIGTVDHAKYIMECECKFTSPEGESGRWFHTSYGIPRDYHNWYLKTYKDQIYIMSKPYKWAYHSDTCVERYRVNNAVRELLGL